MKKDMPLEGLRWSRDSGSALYDTPQNGRSRTGWGVDIGQKRLPTPPAMIMICMSLKLFISHSFIKKSFQKYRSIAFFAIRLLLSEV